MQTYFRPFLEVYENIKRTFHRFSLRVCSLSALFTPRRNMGRVEIIPTSQGIEIRLLRSIADNGTFVRFIILVIVLGISLPLMYRLRYATAIFPLPLIYSLMGGWGVFSVYALTHGGLHAVMTEKIRVTSQTLSLIREVAHRETCQDFAFGHISAIRMTVPEKSYQEALCFEYLPSHDTLLHEHAITRASSADQSGPVLFGRRLGQSGSRRLVTMLNDILTFRCHEVVTILFGELERTHATLLQNPDTEGLTTPFFQLERLVVCTNSYDFRLVERFITYAVNYMRHDYMQNTVDLHVYGDVTEMHPNIRNSLTTLCRSVHVYHATEEVWW